MRERLFYTMETAVLSVLAGAAISIINLPNGYQYGLEAGGATSALIGGGRLALRSRKKAIELASKNQIWKSRLMTGVSITEAAATGGIIGAIAGYGIAGKEGVLRGAIIGMVGGVAMIRAADSPLASKALVFLTS